MDIEGMEDRALSGAIRTIETSRPICFVEMQKTDRQFVLDFFEARRYRTYEGGNNATVIPSEYEINMEEL